MMDGLTILSAYFLLDSKLKHSLLITSINPCGCNAEGEVRALLECGTPIWFYYQGGDTQAYEQFPLGHLVEVDLVGRLCSVIANNGRDRDLVFPQSNCRFETVGAIVGAENRENENLYILETSLLLHIDLEHNDASVQIGDWLSVKGELWADNCWD